jgi:hypothetical protein
LLSAKWLMQGNFSSRGNGLETTLPPDKAGGMVSFEQLETVGAVQCPSICAQSLILARSGESAAQHLQVVVDRRIRRIQLLSF